MYNKHIGHVFFFLNLDSQKQGENHIDCHYSFFFFWQNFEAHSSKRVKETEIAFCEALPNAVNQKKCYAAIYSASSVYKIGRMEDIESLGKDFERHVEEMLRDLLLKVQRVCLKGYNM